MAWIKVRNSSGKILTIPESAYENFFKGSNSLVKVESEVKSNGEIQHDKQNEVKPRRKNSSKT